MTDPLGELVPKVQNIFEFLSVHREMIFDEVRTSAYARAISLAVKEGDVVVDVGTGTGLLALLAVKAGAKKVYAIEKTGIIDVARANASKLGLEDRIEFIRDDSRNARLHEQADVIVSEVIGHLVVEENMLDSVLDARDRFLKPGGKLIPSTAAMYFVPVEAAEVYEDEIGVWRTMVQGVDLSGSQEFAVNNLYNAEFKEEDYLADPRPSKLMNFRTIDNVQLSFKGTYSVRRNGLLHGIAGWFVARLYSTIEISTAPTSERTHWKQCFFPAKGPFPVKAGDTVSFDFSSKTLGDDVAINWQIAVRDVAGRDHSVGASQTTTNNERSFSLRKLWLNKATNSAADVVSNHILELGY